ncbi:MAG: NAD(P)-dependent oxidoreductase, partial [Reinekea sp.]
IVVTASLTPTSRHMLNDKVFEIIKTGVRVVNVGRGPVIDEQSLENALKSGKVYSAALDVFEIEPLPSGSYLRAHPHCIFGSHNASNTSDAVQRTSEIAISKLYSFMGVQ